VGGVDSFQVKTCGSGESNEDIRNICRKTVENSKGKILTVMAILNFLHMLFDPASH
jgi:hypothetical protein